MSPIERIMIPGGSMPALPFARTRFSTLLQAAWVLAVLLFASSCGAKKEEKGATEAAPEPEVIVTTAVQMSVPRERYEIGMLKAPEEVELRARVRGFLDKRLFEEGTDVKQDQLLMVIDEAPFKVQVDIAAAALQTAEVKLKLAKDGLIVKQAEGALERSKAALANAQVEVKRYTDLVKAGAESQQNLDKYLTQERELKATVDVNVAGVGQANLEQRAQIDSGTAEVAGRKADLEKAVLDLSYCKINAPLAGRVGQSTFSKGALVGSASNETLATVRQVDPLEVAIKIDGKLLPRVQQAMKQVREIAVEISNDKYLHPHRGKVTFVDNTVDPDTSTFLIKATVPNPDKTLLPGLFVKTRLIIGMTENAILVPERCIVESPRGPGVYVVDAESKINAVPVTLGDSFDDVRAVTTGVKNGDVLVSEGVQFIKPGIKVKTKDQPLVLPDSLKRDAKPATGGAETPPVAPAPVGDAVAPPAK
jgi:membrane fusion protein (multidrug efflux system)